MTSTESTESRLAAIKEHGQRVRMAQLSLAPSQRNPHLMMYVEETTFLLAEVAALQARAEAAESEYVAQYRRAAEHAASITAEAERKLLAAEARIESLEAAARPFTTLPCYCEPYWLRDYHRHGPNCVAEKYTDEMERLSALLSPPSTPPDPDAPWCRGCSEAIWRDSIGEWWHMEGHPADDHRARPGGSPPDHTEEA